MKRCIKCDTRFDGVPWTCPTCGFAPASEHGIPVFAPELAREISGYESALFEGHGGEEAERSFWTSARSSLIVWALATYAPGAKRFLEIGCGTGGVLRRIESAFPAMQCIGAEALIDGLRAAQSRVSRTSVMQFDATQIPFADEFDAVGAFDVLEHIPDDNSMLRAMAASIRPGGSLILTVPQHQWLFGPADVSAKHERRYDRFGLKAQVERAGLRVRCATSFVSLLFPAMASVRLVSKWRGGEYDSAEEFKIGPLNNVFTRVMAAERWTIRKGMRWPFGGSLLVVARKEAA